MLFTFLDRFQNLGILVLRVGLGITFILHGFPKLQDGPEKWTELGLHMHNFGVTFQPAFWGFMAAFSEFAGGILLILGFLFRPASLLLLATMVVATTMHMSAGHSFGVYSHALELAIVMFSLLFIGPGTNSMDARLAASRKKKGD